MTIRQGHNVIAGSSGRQLQDAFPLFFDHRFTFDPQDIRWVNSEDYSWLDGEVYRGGYNKLLSQYQPTGIFKATSLNYTCVFSDLSIVETNVPVATGTITDLQDWATSAGYTTTGTTIEELVVQKSLVSSSETIAGVVISFYRCYDKKKIVLTDQITAVEAIYAATGVAEYFILDIANKQFKLPRNKWGRYGTGSGDLGDYVEESLPNAKGSGRGVGASTDVWTGAFKYLSSPANSGHSSVNESYANFDFDLSRASSAYQDGAPVQPRGAKGDLYFYLGDSDADIVGKAYVTDALIQSKANNSEVLHKTMDESFTGTKTGYGVNTPIALKRNNTYTEIQTQKSDGTRTGGFRSIQETDSTVNQTIMYVADGSSYKGDISLHYDSANDEVWATLPAISMPYIRKQNSDLEGGEIHFESADNEVNAGKPIYIDRYNGKIRVVGQNSSGTTNTPFQVDVQNNGVNITQAWISSNCYLQKNSTDVRYIAKDTGYAQGDTVSANRYSGIRMFDKNNTEIGTVYTQVGTDGNVTTRLSVKTPTAGATTSQTMGIGAKPDGTFWTFAPTPSSATNNSTQIATTAHIINVLKLMYPVGSVYIGTQSTCPMSQLFGTWSLVSSGKALWTGNGSNGNTTINAGLPDITIGDASIMAWRNNEKEFTQGALSKSTTHNVGLGGSYWVYTGTADFKASRANSIYGKSSTVQPPAYVVNVWRRTA